MDDTIDALGGALDACAGADIIVFSGGSSVGERDLIVDLIAARGEMIFHGIAVKPGKPTAFARLHAGGTPFFGMPGNPTSCLSNAYVLLVPFLRAVARLPPLRGRTVRVPLGTPHRLAGRPPPVLHGDDSTTASRMPAFKGSGEITSLSHADGYIEIPADQSVVEKRGSRLGARSRSSDHRVMPLTDPSTVSPIRLSYSCSSTSAVCRSKAGAVRALGAAELGVAAVADGEILQPAVDDQIDERRGGEDAVGDEIALEPVEDRADRRRR